MAFPRSEPLAKKIKSCLMSAARKLDTADPVGPVSRLLDKTFERMRELRAPTGVEWELLVVNNNCTDETDAVIERHRPHLPLTRLFEPKQGLSNARNSAIEHARGRFLVWTDDDVLVNVTACGAEL
jgi:glycosyltransferase involved in cell wall biosynthesis